MIVTPGSLIPGHLVSGAPDPDGLVAATEIRVVEVDTGAEVTPCFQVDTDTGDALVLRRNERGFPVFEDGRVAVAPHPKKVRLELRS